MKMQDRRIVNGYILAGYKTEAYFLRLICYKNLNFIQNVATVSFVRMEQLTSVYCYWTAQRHKRNLETVLHTFDLSGYVTFQDDPEVRAEPKQTSWYAQ
jgi:hypothetical protein